MGYTVSLLLLFSLLRGAISRHSLLWLGVFALFVILSLGPSLNIPLGSSTFKLPLLFALFRHIPILKGIRVPWRAMQFAFLPLAVFIGLHVERCLRWLATIVPPNKRREAARMFAGIIAIGICLEYARVPFIFSDKPRDSIPAFYQSIIAADPEDVSVLEMPVSWVWAGRMTDRCAVKYMYYPPFHHKRMVDGYVSKNHPYIFSYFTQLKLFNVFLALQNGRQPSNREIENAKNLSTAFCRLARLKYLVLHKDMLKRLPKHCGIAQTEYVALIERVFHVKRAVKEGDITLFELHGPIKNIRTLYNMDDQDIAVFLFKGFCDQAEQGRRWAIDKDVKFALPQPAAKTSCLEICLAPYEFGGRRQIVTVYIHGKKRLRKTLQNGEQTIRVPIDTRDFHNHVLYVDAAFAYAVAPHALGVSADKRTLSACFKHIRFN